MKIKILTASMALTAMTFTSCNKDDNQNLNGELRLSSGVTAQLTRASFGMDTQIASNEKVAVYVDKAASTQIYGNNVLTADGNGRFTGGTTMYFPSDKSKVDIYAFHTNGGLGNNFPTVAITHTVNADQNVKADYAASDLLYAANKGVAFTKDAVGLTFYHMLSKVEVALKVGAGNPDLKNAEVSIIGIQLKADFTPNKTADMTTQAGRAAMIGITSADNEAKDIKISNDVTSNENWDKGTFTYNEVVIVPQKVLSGEKFIKVKLSNDSELFYKLPEDITFESGKKYSYEIKVNLTELTVTSTINDWEAVNPPVAGDAEME